MTTNPGDSLYEGLARYPLLDALLDRRSRRFGKGMTLNGAPLAYASEVPPAPLTLEEEAALAFAACGITGHALGELPYQTGDVKDAAGGNIMGSFVGRTIPSGDALHSTSCVIINDDGAWFLKRPQNLSLDEIQRFIGLARERKLVEAYTSMRVKLADGRVGVPREVPYCPPFNKWSANVPGSTYFLPVMEYSSLYLNVLLEAFGPEIAMFVVDERNGMKPAGIGDFTLSKGGYLDDGSPAKIGTVGYIESAIFQLVALESGAMIQNLALMTQALGLGGFPHSAAHPEWLTALGFQSIGVPLSKVLGLGTLETLAAKLLGKDMPIPTAVALERGGAPLLTPRCVPNYPTMEAAVRAHVASKYAPGTGIFRDGGAAAPFLHGAKLDALIPRYGEPAIAATIAYATYVQERYGRFPATSAPLATMVAYQAHRLDPRFYDTFYPRDALSETQRRRESAPTEGGE